MKSLISGIMAFSLLLGVGSTLNPVGAVNQKPDTGKKGVEAGQVFDIYIHGFVGGQGSVDSMMRSNSGAKKNGKSYQNNLNYAGQWGTFVGKEEQTIFASYSATSAENLKRRSYDVIFYDNMSSIKAQSAYLKVVVDRLTKYGAKVNLIGHSMGGVAATSYVTHYENMYSNPRVNKLITLGSPIKGASSATLVSLTPYANSYAKILTDNFFSIFKTKPSVALNDLKFGSEAVKDIFEDSKGKERTINPKIKVYSVYGGFKNSKGLPDNMSDNIVEKSSSTYLKNKVSAKNYREYGASGVGHTKLMSDKKVIAKVYSWIK